MVFEFFFILRGGAEGEEKLSRRDKWKQEARITLRDFRLEDANYMKNWNRGKNEDNMMTRYGWPVIYSKADAMRSLKQMSRSEPWFQAICLSNIPIGDISLSRELDWILPDLDKDDSDGEMGYYIAPHSRGRGYGSVAVKKFVDVCFNRFKGLKSITACVFLDNIPSQRLSVACGFQRLLKDGGQRPLIGMYKDGNYKLRKIFFYRVYRPDLLESKHEAASAYGDASNSFKKISPKDAISCLDQAVNEFMEIGRFNMAARYCKEIGELYEVEQTSDQAIVYFERSADLFQSEEVTTSANQCKLKVAQFSAQLEQYPRAIEIYEEIARQSLKNNLLKYSVKGYLLNAGLCQLCKGDVIAITNALERYQELDPSFNGTREHKFLADLAAALDEEDVAKFTDVVKDFDSMTMLDAWKTTLLLRVKEKLKAKELEEDDLT